jgi:cbb3-type cytochrome oxidase subunit 3
MTTVVASHFLAGAILTLVLPLILLVLIGIYWWALLRRRGGRAQQ